MQNLGNKDEFHGYRYICTPYVHCRVQSSQACLENRANTEIVVIWTDSVIKIQKTKGKATKNQHLLHVTHFLSNNSGHRVINLKVRTMEQGKHQHQASSKLIWDTCPSLWGHPPSFPLQHTGCRPFNSLRLSVTEAYLLHIKWANISYVV